MMDTSMDMDDVAPASDTNAPPAHAGAVHPGGIPPSPKRSPKRSKIPSFATSPSKGASAPPSRQRSGLADTASGMDQS